MTRTSMHCRNWNKDCQLMCCSCFVAEAFIPQGSEAEKWQYSESAQWVAFCKPRSAKRMYRIISLSSYPVDLLCIITVCSTTKDVVLNCVFVATFSRWGLPFSGKNTFHSPPLLSFFFPFLFFSSSSFFFSFSSFSFLLLLSSSFLLHFLLLLSSSPPPLSFFLLPLPPPPLLLFFFVPFFFFLFLFFSSSYFFFLLLFFLLLLFLLPLLLSVLLHFLLPITELGTVSWQDK